MRRGDIFWVGFDPTKGREQQGARPVLVVSTTEFNRHNPPLVCPIATAALGQRFGRLAVSLATAGTQTTGVVLCSQIRALDIKARQGRRIETAPDFVVGEVLDCLRDILE
jgi:mRNA-degrading endonuclease toxin of MazEF toxin-antitoxin module